MKKISELIQKKPGLTLFIILILMSAVIYLSYSTIKMKTNYVILDEKMNLFENKFELLSPSIARMETEDFLEKQKYYNVNYRSLKQQVITELAKHPDEKYGFYFEDLATGSWIGINEKERFIPRSLFKVPLMVLILKKVEEGELSLDQKVIVKPADLLGVELETIVLTEYETTIGELIAKMIQESDNAAVSILINKFIVVEDYVKIVSTMGLPTPLEDYSVSPKEYANIFRSLYLSTYLRRPFSELALTILLDTKFNSQLPAGLPKDVKISHKVGFDKNLGFYHDCGIVYLPEHPYLICIMSQDNTQENADEMMSSLSKIVYEYNAKIMEG